MSASVYRPEHGCTTAHGRGVLPECLSLRLHDSEQAGRWADQDRDGFGGLDLLIAWAVKTGGRLIDCTTGTPARFATSKTPDLYGVPGGASIPSSLTVLEDHAYAKGRYANGRSKLNPTGIHVVRLAETLNEYKHGFLQGSTADALRWHLAVRAGWKRADKTVTILAPSVLGDQPDDLAEFLLEPDGEGGRGGDWCDGAAIHWYGATMQTLPGQLDALRNIAAKCGFPNLKFAGTERTASAGPDDWLQTNLYLASQPDVIADVYYSHDGRADLIMPMRESPALQEHFSQACGYAGKTVRVDGKDFRVSGKKLQQFM